MAYFTMAKEGTGTIGTLAYFTMYDTSFPDKLEIASSRGRYARVRRFDVIRLLSPVRDLPAVRDPEPVRQL